ncbi:MocR-like pyridoxine biosynthesis transcription factor PdxR [Chitinimonas koreensis]|uniref:MocR-like pyridoxine biosynthesis transcription factor PdxR n=1 Tax=Chitinimonas koreensis TaxID=356302 RepID=UPI0003FA15E8|nr:PLP-dependent aminotransferase family protein [Chitinimonas koreensis]QNM97072.1 PLP-dependent aminotransferase family protein [Chitinimonas koreensis]
MSTSSLWLALFQQSAEHGRPLREQLCGALRQAIAAGTLAQHARLPSSRVLAADLALSRVTVEAAYAQLEAEGYLERRIGQGTLVRIALPPAGRAAMAGPAPVAAALSARGRRIVTDGGCVDPQQPRAFCAGSPELRAFPHDTWRQLNNRRLRRDGEALMRYGDPQGHPALRRAIAHYLGQSRGVRCDAGQVLVLTSSQQALQLLATVLLDPADPVWIEEPAYRGARTAFAAAGATLLPVPVDGDGLRIEEAAAGDPAAGGPGAGGPMTSAPATAAALPIPRLIYLTPSHQYPTGATLSLARRLALVDYAGRHGCWLVEDDYDGEFHYDGRPQPALQGLDPHGRTLYLGTFSKALFPSLRLAYLVLPPALVAPLTTARTVHDGHCAQLAQAVTADFIEQGHFAAHLRYMRQLYRGRRDALLEAIGGKLPWLTAQPNTGGLQLAATLPPDWEAPLSRQAAALGIATPSLSALYGGPAAQDGWLLGYAALTPEEIAAAVDGLATLRLPPR